MDTTRSGVNPEPAGSEPTEESLSFFAFLRQRNPRLFAHHLDHPVFKDHVWEYRGLYFCKGCTMTFAGIFFGALLAWLTGWLRWFSDQQVGFIFLGLLLPAVATSLMNLPRITKHVARFLLGVLVVSAATMIFVTDSWAVRLAVVGTFLAVRTPLERKRRRDNQTLLMQCRARGEFCRGENGRRSSRG